MKKMLTKKNIIIFISILIVLIVSLYFLLDSKVKITLDNKWANLYTWTCEVEDKDIVKIVKNKVSKKDEMNSRESFIFKGLKKGETTILCKLQQNKNKSYSDAKEYKVKVKKNLRMEFKEG